MGVKDKLQQRKKIIDPKMKQLVNNLKVMGVYDVLVNRTYTQEDLEANKETIELLRRKYG